jgi:NAD(P)-dependent dehydrogenase (short-subunit alcohol dehydrogenase family)
VRVAAAPTRPVALVTGASSGIGKDIALRLLAEGYCVHALARRVERMADIAEAGGVPVAMDVTNGDQMVRAVDAVLAQHGRIDILVNAAGYGQYGALEDVPVEDGRRQMEVNLFGAARLIQLCLPHMRAQRFGAIVNISSIGGKIAFPMGGWYHASKFALEAYSDSLRNEVGRFGIRVIVIEPGGVATGYGAIATHESTRLSGSGPYAPLAAAMDRLHGETGLPGPTVISDLVVRALRSKRPRARYAGGFRARPMLFLKRWLSDRSFDRLLAATFK